ncbi:MAG: heavy metal translocating P-type ATPase [Bacillota bacterium]
MQTENSAVNQVNSEIKAEKDQVKKELIIKGISCADCAAEIERRVSGLETVEKVNLNFVTEKINFVVSSSRHVSETLARVKDIILEKEPQVDIQDSGETREESIPRSRDTAGFIDRIKNLSPELKKRLLRSGIGFLFFLGALVLELDFGSQLVLYVTAYLLIGSDVLYKFVRNLFKGSFMDENFLMTVATMGAFAIQEYPEAVAVMLFYQVGDFFQEVAVNHSRSSIKELLDIKAEYANLKQGNTVKKVEPEEVEVGDLIVVKPGEKIPLDGIVVSGESMVDTAALTGESVPRKVKEGEEVLSGTINRNELLTVEVTTEYEDSTVSKILQLVEDTAGRKAKVEKFITKFARYYTPAVVGGAFLLAVIPPLFVPGAVFSDWLYRALVFLVISCPCALVVSIPLGFFGGIGAASRHGILVKGGNYLEALNSANTIIMDKTGTVTQGDFDVIEIEASNGFDKQEVLTLAMLAEQNSNHPIANSIMKEFKDNYGCPIKKKVEKFTEIAGQGLKVLLDGDEILAGNKTLMAENDIDFASINSTATVVHIAKNRTYAGYLVIADQLKPDAKKTVEGLKALGSKKVIMLTGDSEKIAREMADELKIDDYYAELLPDQKVSILEEKMNQKENTGKVLFIGDGINDAPVLTRADIGVAMGALGSDAAIEAADIVLMKDKPSDLVKATKIARFTRRVVWENIILALGIKGAVLGLGAFGLAGMWEAVFADVGVALLAIFNALRISKLKM